MCAQALTGTYAGDDACPSDNDYSDLNPARAVAVLGRFLKRLGATRVRTTFILVRFEGVDAQEARLLCAEAAGAARLYLQLDASTFVIVDIGPRRARNFEKAERDITELMTQRLSRLIGQAEARESHAPRVFMNAVHSWNVELADLSYVIRQLLAAPPEVVRTPV
ncbi:MAG: hypothetical protein GY791_08985 [Alphaproteobacteria bacterium]|nr:hypothetical protein [Alphaproteobacteria bacterium]